MLEQVSMPALKSMPPPESNRPNTTTTAPLSLYPPKALIPSNTTHAAFDRPQLIDLTAPTVV